MIDIKRGMHVYADFPPHIKIEVVGGCNRSCAFCGIPYKDGPHRMTQETFAIIANEIRNHTERVKTVDFCMHGESTLNPLLNTFVLTMRESLPEAKLMISTNGDVLTAKGTVDPFRDLFHSGMSFITLDLYDEKSAERFYTALNKDPSFSEEFIVQDFYRDGCNQFSSGPPKKPTLIVIDESHGFNKGNTLVRDFCTMGSGVDIERWEEGGLALSSFPVMKACSELMKYLPIRYNGEISACCADGSRSVILGSVTKDSIEDVWTSDLANMIRSTLKKGRRDAIPSCYACNRLSFRDALWPYQGPDYDTGEVARTFADRMIILPHYAHNMSVLHVSNPIKNKFIRRRMGLEEGGSK